MVSRTTFVCFALVRTRTRSFMAAVVLVAILAALAAPVQAGYTPVPAGGCRGGYHSQRLGGRVALAHPPAT